MLISAVFELKSCYAGTQALFVNGLSAFIGLARFNVHKLTAG
jgi:hypothetical protein